MANVNQNQCLYITNLFTTTRRQQRSRSINQWRQNPSRNDLVEDAIIFACVNLIPLFSCSILTTLTKIFVTVSLQSRPEITNLQHPPVASESILTRLCQSRRKFCLCRYHPIIFLLLTSYSHFPKFNA